MRPADTQHPAKFDMTLHPASFGAVLHITSQPLTPRLRHPGLETLGLFEHSSAGEWDYSTPLDVAFEPLRFRAIPDSTFRTLLPAVAIMLLLGVGFAKYLLQLLDFEFERASREERQGRLSRKKRT